MMMTKNGKSEGEIWTPNINISSCCYLTFVFQLTQPVQTAALSVLPMSYPVNQSLVLQKVAIVPKGLDGLTPLVSTHFITAQQQINGKVVPITQYVVKPVVVVSTASPRPS